MKKYLFLTCYLLTSSFLAWGSGNQTLVVETRKVIESSKAHQDIMSKVQKKNEEYREMTQKSEALLKKKYQELETKKNALPQEALDKKNDEIGKEVAELQKKSYSQHSALEEAYRKATQVLLDKTSSIVSEQAKAKGAELVIEKAALVYAKESLDITQAVLDELNKTTPSLEVSFKVEEEGKAEPEKGKN